MVLDARALALHRQPGFESARNRHRSCHDVARGRDPWSRILGSPR
jgi:hypothetical protein